MALVFKQLARRLSNILWVMFLLVFMMTAQTVYWTACPEQAALAHADDSDDLLLSIPPILAAVAAQSQLKITAPAEGEVLTAGSWYWITWDGVSQSGIETIDIELSTDDGATWPEKYKVAKATPNDGVYVWVPVPFHDPGSLRNTRKLRFLDSANPDTAMAESGFFSLQAAAEPMYLEELDEDNDYLALYSEDGPIDSDEDGLYDNIGLYLGTDPLHWDSDKDGYNDYREVFPDDVLNQPVPDRDGDGKITAVQPIATTAPARATRTTPTGSGWFLPPLSKAA